MGIQNIPFAKIASISLFIIGIAFSATMIGTNGVYLQGRIDACYDAGYTNCPDRIHDYLFLHYRNTTFKVFTDCFMLFFVFITFVLFTAILHKIPRFVQFTLLFIILGLSVMSLVGGYRSIDQEDEENYPIRTVSLPNLIDQISTGTTKLQAAQAQKTTVTGQLAAAQTTRAQLVAAGQPTTPADTAIAQATAGLAQLNAGIADGTAKIAAGVKARDGIYHMFDTYDEYRRSVVALVLVNFVAIYTLGLLHVFKYPQPTSNKVTRLDHPNNGTAMEELALKNKHSSNETDVANLP